LSKIILSETEVPGNPRNPLLSPDQTVATEGDFMKKLITLLSWAALVSSTACFAADEAKTDTTAKKETPAQTAESPAKEDAPKKDASAKSKKESAPKKPVILLETSKGNIKIELDSEKAPISTKNFVEYVKAKFYDGTIFHRVIPGFMIQGGGFTPDMTEKTTRAPIKNEASNGLKNVEGSIAMARTPNPNSATAQFFINVTDNPRLDHTDESDRGYGYAVFGKVIDGMKVVKEIEKVNTGDSGMHQNVPTEPVLIKKAKVVK
jgi:peptidyl-prolyl cis-trans isomerase B (cyclophilin B)